MILYYFCKLAKAASTSSLCPPGFTFSIPQPGRQIDPAQVLRQRQGHGFVECHAQAPFQKPAAVNSPREVDGIRKPKRTRPVKPLKNERLHGSTRGTWLAQSAEGSNRRNTCAFHTQGVL